MLPDSIGVFAQLPDRAAFVVEDYASDMALHYYMLIGEAGLTRGIEHDSMRGSASVASDRRVFAFVRAAPSSRHRASVQAVGSDRPKPLDEWVTNCPRAR
jgi:hypothetical protein